MEGAGKRKICPAAWGLLHFRYTGQHELQPKQNFIVPKCSQPCIPLRQSSPIPTHSPIPAVQAHTFTHRQPCYHSIPVTQD